MNDDFPFELEPQSLSLSQKAMASQAAPYMDKLNPAQVDAVLALDGPVLMLAGAGTGKTKALTARIVHLLSTGQRGLIRFWR
jgi:DNA helicase-2/ATP-dependent DNA helicase PcrA